MCLGSGGARREAGDRRVRDCGAHISPSIKKGANPEACGFHRRLRPVAAEPRFLLQEEIPQGWRSACRHLPFPEALSSPFRSASRVRLLQVGEGRVCELWEMPCTLGHPQGRWDWREAEGCWARECSLALSTSSHKTTVRGQPSWGGVHRCYCSYCPQPESRHNGEGFSIVLVWVLAWPVPSRRPSVDVMRPEVVSQLD